MPEFFDESYFVPESRRLWPAACLLAMSSSTRPVRIRSSSVDFGLTASTQGLPVRFLTRHARSGDGELVALCSFDVLCSYAQSLAAY